MYKVGVMTSLVSERSPCFYDELVIARGYEQDSSWRIRRSVNHVFIGDQDKLACANLVLKRIS